MTTVDRHTVLGILHKNEKDRLFFLKKFNIKKWGGSDLLNESKKRWGDENIVNTIERFF